METPSLTNLTILIYCNFEIQLLNIFISRWKIFVKKIVKIRGCPSRRWCSLRRHRSLLLLTSTWGFFGKFSVSLTCNLFHNNLVMIIYDIVFMAFFILYFLDPGLAWSVTQSMLLHGLFKFVTWICQHCYMYLSKLLHGFVSNLITCICQVCLLPIQTKLKFEVEVDAWSLLLLLLS